MDSLIIIPDPEATTPVSPEPSPKNVPPLKLVAVTIPRFKLLVQEGAEVTLDLKS